jgi:hypothetical protein
VPFGTVSRLVARTLCTIHCVVFRGAWCPLCGAKRLEFEVPVFDDVVPTLFPGEYLPAVDSPRAPVRERARLLELSGHDRLKAAQRVVMEWRFPRQIDPVELVLGHWFAWGRSVVFWLVPDEGLDPVFPAERLFGVHIASAPGAREAPYLFDWQAVLLVVADLLGAGGLFAQPIPGTSAERAIRPLLRRLGWREVGPRWYLSLSGGGVGFETSQGAEGALADQRADRPAGKAGGS